MTREQVIDEIADDRVRLVPELRDNPTNEDAGPAMPLEIDHPMRFAGAVDLCPTVRPPGAKMLGRNEIEFLLQLRITHDAVPQ